MYRYFIETRQVGLVQESSKYVNATKKGRTSNKIRSNTKLPLGAFNKLLKTQASEIFPYFYENLLRLRVYNIRAKFFVTVEAH